MRCGWESGRRATPGWVLFNTPRHAPSPGGAQLGHLAWTDRTKVLEWLNHHPSSVHGDAAIIIARAEREARRRAREGAWAEARDTLQRYGRRWETRWSAHASDEFVLREVLPNLARLLSKNERHVQPGDHLQLVGQELISLLEPDALEAISEWAVEVGEQEHHRIWQEIIEYTRTRGRELMREGKLPTDESGRSRSQFTAKAAQLTRLLIREFDSRARLAS